MARSISCDLTHNGKDRKIYTKREPVRAISAITPFNHPAQHGQPQDRAVNRHQ